MSELIAGLDLASRALQSRPYTVANFVASADGRAAVNGRSRGLGDEGDKQVFHALRGVADAVLVGTGTLRVERYRRLVRDPEARRSRVRRGLAPEPIACIVTRSGEVPLDIPLFHEPEARVIIFTGAELDLARTRALVEVVPVVPGQLTMGSALAHLREHENVGLVLCEGGPTVFGALMEEKLVDELFLTLAPKLVSGSGPSVTAGPELPQPVGLTLVWALEQAASLFLRYAIST